MDAVHWFEPFDYDIDIDKILASETKNRNYLLKKYTWHNMVQIIYNALKGILICPD